MWSLDIRVQGEEVVDYKVRPGCNSIGRSIDNEIVISDPSASRVHAELNYDIKEDKLVLNDIGSTNGTFINRERVIDSVVLKSDDIIRIGGTTIDVSRSSEIEKTSAGTSTSIFNRELVLEALDHYSVLMYEISDQLNLVFDKDSTFNKVSELLQKAMGADRCEVILPEDFSRIREMGFPSEIADQAISQKSAVIVQDIETSPLFEDGSKELIGKKGSAICVPIIVEGEVLGIIYLVKDQLVDQQPFTRRDLKFSVIISHQASLTLQRLQLLNKIREEQRIREIFERFVSPAEVKSLMRDYLHNGYLPGLMERDVTILFADIANSTELAERIGAQAFGEILNRYYWDVTDTIFSNDGLVKYLGDGIMAIFGMTGSTTTPLNRKQHAQKAVQAALTVMSHIEGVDYGENITIGIGMNTGKTMIGYVGTQERVEVTAVGDVANVAFRLQSIARPNRILIGPETASNISNDIVVNDLGEQTLSGRTKPLRVFEILRTREYENFSEGN
jgi:class 3 adenylate cyclase/pSer/pThr/pTyr-binding forkhead associated (FHA) protein